MRGQGRIITTADTFCLAGTWIIHAQKTWVQIQLGSCIKWVE